jgi:hypothetical protein
VTLDVDLASRAGTPTPAREPTLARVLDPLRGLGERRAVLALLAAALTGTLVGGILTVAVSIFGGFVAVVAGLVVALSLAAGMHAAGLLQMDAERGIGQRSVTDALSQGLQALPLLIVVGLVVLAVVVAVLIAVSLLLALTKVPFLGPLLFVVVFPVSIVAVGTTIAGATVALAFAMGALWQGASPFRALAQTLVVLRRRAVPTLGRFVALGFVVAAAMGVVFGVLSFGFGPVAALAASIVGASDLGGLTGGIAGAVQVGGGHVAAGAIGSLLLWAAALSLVGQVWLRGICGIYLDMSEGVDASTSEAELRDRVGDARRRAATATSTVSATPFAWAGSPAAAATGTPEPPEPKTGATPPWEESTSPSTTASSSLPAPTEFERLQRAAFGEGPQAAPATTSPPSMAFAPPQAAEPDDDATVPPSLFSATRSTTTPVFPPIGGSAADVDLLLDDPAPMAAADPPSATGACPRCSAETTPDDLFCNRCGQRLRAPA